MDLYALIDFESSNPESYLLSVKLRRFSKIPQVRKRASPLLPLAIEQLICVLMTSSSHTVAGSSH